MVINKEHRTQYIFISLSGALTSALLILIYVSMQISVTEKYKDERKSFQNSLKFVKPSLPWSYNNTWRSIGEASQGHIVYSAYFDPRTELLDIDTKHSGRIAVGSIRTFAILPGSFSDRVACILRYDDFHLVEVIAENPMKVKENHGRSYFVWIITCPVIFERNESNTVQLPNAIALAYASNPLSHISPTFVQISYPRDMQQIHAKSKPSLSVCVGPVQFGYANALRIAEFVEMYRILGASHFYFYYLDGSNDVQRLLHYYKAIGVADVLTWNMPNSTDIHYGGIVGQFNECVLRAMVVDNHRYAAVVDFDEILMPLKHNGLSDFLRQCDEGRTSGFVFRNVFYYNKDSNDTFNVPEHSRNRVLYTQAKVRRTVEIMPAHERSKCVVNTRAIIAMGNHMVIAALPGYTEHTVHPSVGLLFHYRDKCLNCKALLMVDYTARRFGSLIWDRVDDTCLHVFLERNGMCPAV